MLQARKRILASVRMPGPSRCLLSSVSSSLQQESAPARQPVSRISPGSLPTPKVAVGKTIQKASVAEDVMRSLNQMANEIAPKPAAGTPDTPTDAQPRLSPLEERQIALETEQQEAAKEKRRELVEALNKSGRAANLKQAQRGMVAWYEPLLQAVCDEVTAIQNGEKREDRALYGPCLLTVPPEKVAVAVLDCVLGNVLRCGNEGVRIGPMLSEIGSLIETESTLERLAAAKDPNNKMQVSYAQRKLTELRQGSASSRGKSNTKHVQDQLKRVLQDTEPWEMVLKTKVGGVLLEMVMRSVKTTNDRLPEAVFSSTCEFVPSSRKRINKLFMLPSAYEGIRESEHGTKLLFPRHLPMLVKPEAWNNFKYMGAYKVHKAPLMKHTSKMQMTALRHANGAKDSKLEKVLQGLDYLGSVAWKINPKVHAVIQSARGMGLVIGEIPPAASLPDPQPEDYLLPEGAPLPIVPEGKEPMRTADGRLVDRPLYYQIKRRTHKKNSEMHSLRCDLQIKMDIADRFLHEDEGIYFPHNIDFRGRAYPVPPNLSHIGADLCRGLLAFAEAKPLGAEGLRWLKVHLANLWGHNKIPFDERVAWVDEHMDMVRDSALYPLEGDMWWAKAESPFQALAACFELQSAMELADPAGYLCRLPVHQDGSCNGLQHYAGLGRDELGGKAVNLAPADRPQDVYSKVLEIVQRKIDEHLLREDDDPDFKDSKRCAAMVKDVVCRKVIKQTVMTSVYGVTAIGAKAQIHARLEEFYLDAQGEGTIISPQVERDLAKGARYLAKLTLVSLKEMFGSAKAIMDWLATVSNMVAQQGQTMSWITPLGLPVMQPYRKQAKHAVRTVMQRVVLTMDSDFLPVEGRKQRSAFPPNFVHSLDATHMLMTCLRMKERKLTFAAVHDSYWTHAADASTLAGELRESFTELYKMDILEDLKKSIEIRFPGMTLPALPQRGTLDVSSVKDSKYFFH